MFVRVRKRASGKQQVQIVENQRIGKKVKQTVIRSIGMATNEKELRMFKGLAEELIIQIKNDKKPVLPIFDPKDFHTPKKRSKPQDEVIKVKDIRHESKFNDGIRDIFGNQYEQLGYNNIIKSKHKEEHWNGLLKSTVLARIADPTSKRSTVEFLSKILGIDISLDSLYRMMDHVATHEDKIKKDVAQQTVSLFENKVDVLFFDVTTLYFESTETDELRQFGYSKDCKFKESQIVLALVATNEGLPITYKLFPGNMYEGKTLLSMVEELKNDYHIDQVLLVADRAMFTNDNLDLMDKNGIQYIVAAKLKGMKKDIKKEILDDQNIYPNAIQGEFFWLKELEVNSRRVIVSYSSKRAAKDQADRKRLIDRLLKQAKDGSIPVKNLIPNYGSKKFINVKNDMVSINQSKIDEASHWDGLHGVITNAKDLTTSQIITRYKSLWQIEEAFRVNKHSLKMRPIFHWKPRRIRAHIAICFLAYSVCKHVAYRLKEAKTEISLDKARAELNQVESYIIKDNSNQNRYSIPSKLNKVQQTIYKIFGIKRDSIPTSI